MMSKDFAWVAIIALFAVLPTHTVSAGNKNAETLAGIPPRTVADFLHAVIMAHRNFYTIHIVNPMQQEGIVDVSENWRATKSLPLPVQLLQETSEMAELTGANVHYHLISRWPINKANAPATEFERRGLEAVQLHPNEPYTGLIGGGSGQLFGAVYADLGVTRPCIECHNLHPNSPKSDFKVGDVMGGLVITFPLHNH
jgi:Protein of unknown function (DUF3365)